MRFGSRDLWGSLVVLALIAAISGERADGSLPLGAAGTGGTAGAFLVATSELRDPRFTGTVVYMVHHDDTGAMGLVINRPIKGIPLTDLLKDAGVDASGVSGEVLVHFGGPVQPGTGFVLHSTDYQQQGTHTLGPEIALTTDPGVLQAIGRGKGPRRHLMTLGYAGWAPQQLEGEIAAGHWEVVPADAALLFDPDAATKWKRAMARKTIVL
jgi:putative transcriptional regulator